MEAELSKIRPHTSSNLPHQKAPATLLSALEATFKEQNTDASPAAYFAGLLTALESTVQSEREGEFKLGDGDILPAELYLLALVGPFVPPPDRTPSSQLSPIPHSASLASLECACTSFALAADSVQRYPSGVRQSSLGQPGSSSIV